MPTSSRILFNDKNHMITILTTNQFLSCSLPPSKIIDFCHLPRQMEAHADISDFKRIVYTSTFYRRGRCPSSSRILFNNKNYITTILTTNLYFFPFFLRLGFRQSTSLVRERFAAIFLHPKDDNLSNPYILTVRCGHRTLHFNTKHTDRADRRL